MRSTRKSLVLALVALAMVPSGALAGGVQTITDPFVQVNDDTRGNRDIFTIRGRIDATGSDPVGDGVAGGATVSVFQASSTGGAFPGYDEIDSLSFAASDCRSAGGGLSLFCKDAATGSTLRLRGTNANPDSFRLRATVRRQEFDPGKPFGTPLAGEADVGSAGGAFASWLGVTANCRLANNGKRTTCTGGPTPTPTPTPTPAPATPTPTPTPTPAPATPTPTPTPTPAPATPTPTPTPTPAPATPTPTPTPTPAPATPTPGGTPTPCAAHAPYTDNGDGTVSDSCGLIWEKKTDDGGIHDKDDTYTWSTGDNSFNGTAATVFLATLNTAPCFAGSCDWRLPTIVELSGQEAVGFATGGIIDMTVSGCGSGSPCINAIFGPTASSFYWTSPTYQGSPNAAWYAVFSDGFVAYTFKTDYKFVRAVRSGS